MNDEKLTPWFPGCVKPARVGVYLRQYPSEDCYYALFDGVKWRSYRATPLAAAKRRNGVSWFQDVPWRGLAEQPK